VDCWGNNEYGQAKDWEDLLQEELVQKGGKWDSPTNQTILETPRNHTSKNWGEKIYIVARDPMLLRPPLFKFAIVESWIAFACIVALNMNIRYLIFATWWLSVGWQGSFTFHAVPHTLVAPTYLPATLCWARQVMMMYNIFCILWSTIRFVQQYWPS
jgi:hypothetical protein